MKLFNILSIVLVYLLTACGGGGGGSSPNTELPTLQSVKINTSASPIHAGDSVTLTAEGIYSDGSTRSVTAWKWASSNPKVATVSSDRMNAETEGETTVTVEVSSGQTSNMKGSLTIKILPAIAKSVRINGFSGSIFYTKTTYSTKDERQLSRAVVYTDAIREPTLATTWTSSNPSVLTVSDTGYLKAVAAGEATITAVNGALSTSQKISIIQPDATPTFVVYCEQGKQAPISAALWNSKVAADATNSKEWITVDYASCSSNAVVNLFRTKEPGNSTYYTLMEARRNIAAGKFEAPLTYDSTITTGQILTVGNSTKVNDSFFTKMFDITAAD